jgi:small subunit ribosomal protein S27e
MTDVVQKPKSKFLKIKCPDCQNEQTVFDKPSTVVKCLVCDAKLITAKGGKGEIKKDVKIIEVLE